MSVIGLSCCGVRNVRCGTGLQRHGGEAGCFWVGTFQVKLSVAQVKVALLRHQDGPVSTPEEVVFPDVFIDARRARACREPWGGRRRA